MTENDNTQPEGTTQPAAGAVTALSTGPRALPAGRGWGWIREGFGYFMRSPGIWIVMLLIYAVLMTAANAIPLLPLLLNLVTAVFVAGFMLGCQALHDGQDLQVAHMFAGFKVRTKALVGAGALYLGLMIAAVIVVMLLGLLAGISTGLDSSAGVSTAPTLTAGLLVLVLLATALVIPVAMAFWFAPALLVFHQELDVITAFKMSFRGCLANILPFLVYGVVAMLLLIIATIPLMLGLLVLGPTLIASMYIAYREIFLE